MTTFIQIGLSGPRDRVPSDVLSVYDRIKKSFKTPQKHGWEYFIIKPNDSQEWKDLHAQLGPYVSFGREWTRESIEPTMSELIEIATVKYNDQGAWVRDYGRPEKTIMIPTNDIVVNEPDEKFDDSENKRNLNKIVNALRKGKTIPPILLRKMPGEIAKYQVLDGHHRFMAYRLLGLNQVPARVVATFNATNTNEELIYMSEMSKLTKLMKELDKSPITEGTGVTDYNPRSQGGTRKELIAKYRKTGDPKDAEAARRAGATQKELQGLSESQRPNYVWQGEPLKANARRGFDSEEEASEYADKHEGSKIGQGYPSPFVVNYSTFIYPGDKVFRDSRAALVRTRSGLSPGEQDVTIWKYIDDGKTQVGVRVPDDKIGFIKPLPPLLDKDTAKDEQTDEGMKDSLKNIGLATGLVGAMALPGAIENTMIHRTPLAQEIKARAEQGDEQAKQDLHNLVVLVDKSGSLQTLLDRYGFKNVKEPKSDSDREQYQETLTRELQSISNRLLS